MYLGKILGDSVMHKLRLSKLTNRRNIAEDHPAVISAPHEGADDGPYERVEEDRSEV